MNHLCTTYLLNQEWLKTMKKYKSWDGPLRLLVKHTAMWWRTASQEWGKASSKASLFMIANKNISWAEFSHITRFVAVDQQQQLFTTMIITNGLRTAKWCWLIKVIKFITMSLMLLHPFPLMANLPKSKEKFTKLY